MSHNPEDVQAEHTGVEESTQLLHGGHGANAGDSKKKTPAQRIKFYLSIVFYVSVCLIVLAVLVGVIVILIVMQKKTNDDMDLFGLEDIGNGRLSSNAGNGQFFSNQLFSWNVETKWNEDNKAPTVTKCELVKYGSDLKQVVVLNEDQLDALQLGCQRQFWIGDNERYFIVAEDVEHIWRHSSTKNFYVVDLETKTKTKLHAGPKKQKILKVCGKKAAYVNTDNNIFLVNDFTVAAPVSVQITNDGEHEKIFNGINDWVYEEDVWGASGAMMFSPDCSSLAFQKLNDEQVPLVAMTTYDLDTPYPKIDEIRVPAAGDNLPVSSIHISQNGAAPVEIQIPNLANNYIFNLFWADNSNVMVTWINRDQNEKIVYSASVANPAAQAVSTFRASDEEGQFYVPWEVEHADQAISADEIVTMQTNKDYIHLMTQKKGEAVKFLTEGKWNVRSIVAVTADTVFYLSTEAPDHSNAPTEQYLWKVNIADPTKKECINMNKRGFFTASMSSDYKIVMLRYNGGVTTNKKKEQVVQYPETLLFALEDDKNVVKLGDNNVAEDNSGKLSLPKVEFTEIKVNGHALDTLIFKPPNFSKNLRYPILLAPYGGPSVKLVQKTYSAMRNGFSTYMASKGFIVVTVDNRGTGGRTISRVQSPYKELGLKEAADQQAVADFIRKNWKYADDDNIGLWGWSYGGYLTLKTSLVATKEDDAFKAAAAVAPVTDWRYYDTAYSERYMGLPSANLDGYNSTSVVKNIHKDSLKWTNLLLSYGLRDDNVWPTNSINLQTELQNNEIQFDVMTYPNKDHSIAGKHTRHFLYEKISEHFIKHLKPEAPEH